MTLSAALLSLLLAASALDDVVQVEGGGSLDALVPSDIRATSRFGLNGAPPGSEGVLPAAPDQAGDYWLVGHDTEGRVRAWYRFRVGPPGDDERENEGADPSMSIDLVLDVDGPRAQLQVEGPQIEREGRRIVAADARLRLAPSDPSGVVQATLQLDGKALTAPETWAQSRAEGALRISAELQDALGNRATRELGALWLDRSGPQLDWQRLDTKAEVADEVFDGGRARLWLRVSDPLAGVARVVVGDQALDPRAVSEGVELRVEGEALDYVLEDAVGNRSEGRLPLRADREGPELQLSVDGQRVDGASVRITRAQQLGLQAVDTLAGVAQACVEASVWYRECRALPLDLVGLSPGRYALEFRAIDRLGNRSSRRFQVEVVR